MQVGGRSSCSAALAALTTLMVASSACAYWGPPPPEMPAPPWEEDDEPEASRYHPDTQVAMRLLEALTRDEALSRQTIDIVVEDGVVTLLGTVDEPGTRDRALDLVEGVRGVRAVHDRMTLEGDAERVLEPREAEIRP